MNFSIKPGDNKRDPSNPRQFGAPAADRPTVYIRHVSGGGRTLTEVEVTAIMRAVLAAVPGVAADAHVTPIDKIPQPVTIRDLDQEARDREEMIGLLAKLEWSGTYYDKQNERTLASCPMCGGTEEGHAEDCRLAALLKRLGRLP